MEKTPNSVRQAQDDEARRRELLRQGTIRLIPEAARPSRKLEQQESGKPDSEPRTRKAGGFPEQRG